MDSLRFLVSTAALLQLEALYKRGANLIAASRKRSFSYALRHAFSSPVTDIFYQFRYH